MTATNIISPAVLTRKPRSDTRAKIIERVRNGRKSPGSAQQFSNESSASNSNIEVTYELQGTRELDKALSQEKDDVSLPRTASNSQDSMSTRDSLFGETLIEEENTASVVSDVLTDVVTNINTNIKNPGLGFTALANASVNASINYTRVEKKVSNDENNSILEDEQSDATPTPTPPPKRRFFTCGGADLSNEIIQDINVTVRQIMSPVRNARTVKSFVAEKNESLQERIRSFRKSDVAKKDGDESTVSGNSVRFSSKLDENGKTREDRKSRDRVRVGSPEFKAMMSQRKEV
jgi:hypothetical protein